jgi:hypothetical protein
VELHQIELMEAQEGDIRVSTRFARAEELHERGDVRVLLLPSAMWLWTK